VYVLIIQPLRSLKGRNDKSLAGGEGCALHRYLYKYYAYDAAYDFVSRDFSSLHFSSVFPIFRKERWRVYYDWIGTRLVCMCDTRFVTWKTRVVTHPETSDTGRCLHSEHVPWPNVRPPRDTKPRWEYNIMLLYIVAYLNLIIAGVHRAHVK